MPLLRIGWGQALLEGVVQLDVVGAPHLVALCVHCKVSDISVTDLFSLSRAPADPARCATVRVRCVHAGAD